MEKSKKVLGIVSVVAIASVLAPRPAAAIPILDNVLDIVGNTLGISISDKLNDYLQIGMGKLDSLLGLDSSDLGSITGVMGGIDPIKAGQQIDDKLSNFGLTKEDLAIPSLIEGDLQKGAFSVGLGKAIGNSLLTTDAQKGLKDAADGAADLTKESNKLAAKAQKMKVTQDINKVIAQQNGQQIQVLNLQSQKQDLELQQAAATTISTAQTAQNSNAEERRKQEEYNANRLSTVQQSGVANGVLGGL